MVCLSLTLYLHILSFSSRVDIYQPGVIVTTICATIALLATIFLVLTQFWPERATGSLKTQAWLFTFFALWLFATQIPYTVAVANHRAKINAFLGGVQLPAQTVQAAITAAGESDKYSKLHPGTSWGANCLGNRDTYIFSQLFFLPFSLGLHCSLLPSLYSFSLRLPENAYRWKGHHLSRLKLTTKRLVSEHKVRQRRNFLHWRIFAYLYESFVPYFQFSMICRYICRLWNPPRL
jgi:hypothetical protein